MILRLSLFGRLQIRNMALPAKLMKRNSRVSDRTGVWRLKHLQKPCNFASRLNRTGFETKCFSRLENLFSSQRADRSCYATRQFLKRNLVLSPLDSTNDVRPV